MASNLVKEPEVTEIICADRDLERAKQLSDWLKSKKISIRFYLLFVGSPLHYQLNEKVCSWA